MAYLEQLYNHLQQQEVLKVLAALATPGGIWFWIDKYRNRVQIRVRNVRLVWSNLQYLGFEVENVSSIVTSYEPILQLTGYHSDQTGRTKFAYKFTAEMTDRQLAPLVEKTVAASHKEKDKPEINFLWYMTLTITLTRGRKVRVRIRNIEFETIGFLRFQWELFLYRVFGKLP
jgi:hypothetical protein